VSRRRAPRPASNALRSALQRAAPKTRLAAVQGCWEEVVGERVAAVSRPASERDGTITIACSDPVWVEELDLMQDRFLKALRERLGDEAPRALRFRVEDETPPRAR
jgi:predicted nucleic acid-binding Zn ribbon protein